jgi:hypothetical protein
MGIHWKDGYSARVELYLDVGDKRLRVAQVGPASLILRDPCTLPPGTPGTIVINVDGTLKEHAVVLHNGAIASRDRVEFF